MNDEERRQRDWVALRADCTVQGTFEQIVEAIERDVERFNKLDPEKRLHRTFKCERKHESFVFIGQTNSENEWADEEEYPGTRVHARETKIQAFRGKECLFEVQHLWNDDTLTCDLKIDGKCHSVWQISQKAIGELMFGLD